jgi:hypothetical protein
MNAMKGSRLIILTLVVALITICSGLFYYKNLFQIESSSNDGKVNFEDLRLTDLQINSSALMLRLNLSSDTFELDSEILRLKELINILADLTKKNKELNSSLIKIRVYFDQKILNLNKFKMDLIELKKAYASLNPTYNELIKNKIKFSVDGRDFYRECLIDALLYLSSPIKENEVRLLEDKKILSQILGFSNSPNQYVQKLSDSVDIILKRNKEINRLLEDFNNSNFINNDLAIVGKYYKESLESKASDGNIFLFIIIGAIVLYLILISFVMKKLT